MARAPKRGTEDLKPRSIAIYALVQQCFCVCVCVCVFPPFQVRACTALARAGDLGRGLNIPRPVGDGPPVPVMEAGRGAAWPAACGLVAGGGRPKSGAHARGPASGREV